MMKKIYVKIKKAFGDIWLGFKKSHEYRQRTQWGKL